MSRSFSVLTACISIINGVCVGIIMLGLDHPTAVAVFCATNAGLITLALQYGMSKHLAAMARKSEI